MYIVQRKHAHFGGQNVQYTTQQHCVKYPIPQCNALNMTIHFQLDE